MSEIIVKLTDSRIKLKGGEYARDLVRCKDCKYRNKEWYQDKRHKDGGYWLVCCENDAIAERIYGLAQDDDYCSYGER